MRDAFPDFFAALVPGGLTNRERRAARQTRESPSARTSARHSRRSHTRPSTVKEFVQHHLAPRIRIGQRRRKVARESDPTRATSLDRRIGQSKCAGPGRVRGRLARSERPRPRVGDHDRPAQRHVPELAVVALTDRNGLFEDASARYGSTWHAAGLAAPSNSDIRRCFYTFRTAGCCLSSLVAHKSAHSRQLLRLLLG